MLVFRLSLGVVAETLGIHLLRHHLYPRTLPSTDVSVPVDFALQHNSDEESSKLIETLDLLQTSHFCCLNFECLKIPRLYQKLNITTTTRRAPLIAPDILHEQQRKFRRENN